MLKSCIEAYQGIEYIELVCKQNKFDEDAINKFDFKNLWDLDKNGYLDTGKNLIFVTHKLQKGILGLGGRGLNIFHRREREDTVIVNRQYRQKNGCFRSD